MSENRKRKCNYEVQVILDKTQVESEEDQGNYIKSGEGFFHEWGKTIQSIEFCAESPRYVEITLALIEDVQTGKIYMVHPEDIQFIKN